MSITAIDMITDSLRAANVIDQNQTPTAEMGVSGLRLLNQMMGQWDTDGIRLGWVVVENLSDVLPLRLQDERAVKFNFAVELSGEYGLDPLPRVAQIASDTYGALAKAHRQRVESSLADLPSPAARFGNGSAISSGGQ